MAARKTKTPQDGSDLECFGCASTALVEIWTDQYRIVGRAHVPSFGEGAKRRISDVLNQREKAFLSLSEVTLRALQGRKLWQGDFLALNKRSIVLLKALEE